MMAVLTSRFLKIPTAVAVRGEPSMEYYSGWMRFLAKFLFSFAEGVVLQTRQCFSFFPAPVRKKAVILKNPVNPSFFRERYEGEREKEVVAVGRLDANKNHEMLIRAFAAIADQYPEYRLTIYGEGELRESLTALIAELGMEKRIFLPGQTTEVQQAIWKARAFVLPSNTEGAPNTLIEAMLLGLTVIATDCPCGGPADLIVHGENGLLIKVGDQEGLKESLKAVLGNPHYADQLGKKAAERKESYRPEMIYREWENYLNSLALWRK